MLGRAGVRRDRTDPKGPAATRYGANVGRDEFRWSGDAYVGRKSEWATWTPPREMIKRQPEAAKWARGMPGGLREPAGGPHAPSLSERRLLRSTPSTPAATRNAVRALPASRIVLDGEAIAHCLEGLPHFNRLLSGDGQASACLYALSEFRSM